MYDGRALRCLLPPVPAACLLHEPPTATRVRVQASDRGDKRGRMSAAGCEGPVGKRFDLQVPRCNLI